MGAIRLHEMTRRLVVESAKVHPAARLDGAAARPARYHLRRKSMEHIDLEEMGWLGVAPENAPGALACVLVLAATDRPGRVVGHVLPAD